VSSQVYGVGTSYYWGYNYFGDLIIDSNGAGERLMHNVTFAVMEEQQKMTCRYGFDGIWGISFFRGGTDMRAFIGGASLKPEQVLCLKLDESDPKAKALQCKDFNETEAFCPGKFQFKPAVETALQESDTKYFGIYLDVNYDNFGQQVKPNSTSYDVGEVYVGDSAMQNKRYFADTPQTVSTTLPKTVKGESWFWNVPVLSIEVISSDPSKVSDKTFTEGIAFDCNGKCYVDSGNPKIMLPMPVLDVLNNLMHAGVEKGSVLVIKMSGDDENDHISLSFPVDELINLSRFNMVGFDSDGVVLGFSTWLYYYTVFDYGTPTSDGFYRDNTKVTFVGKP